MLGSSVLKSYISRQIAGVSSRSGSSERLDVQAGTPAPFFLAYPGESPRELSRFIGLKDASQHFSLVSRVMVFAARKKIVSACPGNRLPSRKAVSASSMPELVLG